MRWPERWPLSAGLRRQPEFAKHQTRLFISGLIDVAYRSSNMPFVYRALPESRSKNSSLRKTKRAEWTSNLEMPTSLGLLTADRVVLGACQFILSTLAGRRGGVTIRRLTISDQTEQKTGRCLKKNRSILRVLLFPREESRMHHEGGTEPIGC